MNPRLFIGSSAESLTVAYAIQEVLEKDMDCTVWNQNVFELSGSTLDSLINSAKKDYDAAAFVFAAEDRAWIRHAEVSITRDNVIFELGLFMGILGKENVYFIVPRGTQLHLPTDLLGITYADYDPKRPNIQAAVGAACNKIRTQVGKANSRKPPQPQQVNAQSISEDAALAVLQTWIQNSMMDFLLRPHLHVEIDEELRLPKGTSARLTMRAVQVSPRGLEVAADDGVRIQIIKKSQHTQ